ncbi:3-oxoacyl-[acyl-carrier-protein] synthase II [Syntrophus gentianae]|uniref:3-oxoacyl-[acyl-carrier-protein] synthase II n=1 Tax=Syntrophus gentianae TaxID=43775 RepID=A0A1H8B7T0_9BACT|nr:beta-ketoacyl-[acyl-carrier-protein] synthase family protein [Syntrophus gentianae]SEM77937.1 3-oxoacyl-[acyl-carrier-protein] synthase II [Syntrophus gentianae]
MQGKRVVITGLGTVNALGTNAAELAEALQQGRCGIGPVSLFDTGPFRTHTGAQIRNFDPGALISREYPLKRLSRADRMALAATLEALRDAGLYPLPEELCLDTGVIVGGGSGGKLEAETFFDEYLEKGGPRAHFSRLASLSCASSADAIATKLKLWGPKTTLMTACSAGSTAVGLARDLIRYGAARIMIAGGVEPMCRTTYASFNALKAVDPDPCKPFDRERQGLSLGEAAAILILEALQDARRRGAKIYGEVLGYGVTCDAHHMTAPDIEASGAVRAMKAALADAGLEPGQVDYINAHGTGTPANDGTETRAIRSVFGQQAYTIPVSSTKSMTGHTLGASGALEAVISLLAIDRGFIPPTISYQSPDPDCDLDYVTEGARFIAPDIVLSNSFAFGGNNTTVIFGRYREEGREKGADS